EIALSETSHSLSSYLGGLEADPARLEQVETRLATLDKLKRKYGPTLDDILTFLADVQAKLDSVETAAERRAALEKERDTRATQYEAAAHKLSAARQSAAQTLEKSVESELTSLAMAGTIFRIEFTTGAWTPRGTDRIRFLVSANVGEEPKPMDKIASGGELSRLALALKTCTTQPAKPARPTRNSPSSTPRTLVFDEVDAGIGGRTAESVAKRLKRLAASEQVLCVTHLPQVAAYADHHYVVEKKESNGRTIATITHLDGDTRTRELARMLSGTHLTPEALKHAEQLIKLGSRPD
ncbi:MAG: hypothetical protein JST16_14280, partial [Bdellovibrionales bacterium]|nr:hypothetical protein [Bdellovibrionales bacterium]